jgi:hypothetical protein
MMGDIDWFGEVFAAFPEGSIAKYNARVALNMVRNGLAVVAVTPNDKVARCWHYLDARAKKAADKAAQEAGTAKRDGTHRCAVHCVITEESQLKRTGAKKLLDSGINLAVSLAHSTRRIMIVDVDTDAERRAFLADWAEFGDNVDPNTPLTVRSPGVYDNAADVWKHKDGGHLWLNVPDGVELPAKGEAKWCRCHKFATPNDGCEHKWSLFWTGTERYVLVPPSVRAEGPYLVTGQALDAPEWLIKIAQESAERAPAPRTGELNNDDGDPINAWSSSVPWSELLTAAGWDEQGTDSCGCQVWHRPDHASLKTATAHDPGCSARSIDGGHGTLHLWTDAWRPYGPGKADLTKLQFYAATCHGCDIRAAMTALGIDRKRADADTGHADELFVLGDALGKGDAPESAGASTEGEDEEDERPDTWKRVDLTAYLDGTFQPETPSMLVREDGVGLLYDGRVHSIYGESESGKSLILMAEACRLMQEGHDVLWVTLDSDAGEDVRRALSFGCPPEVVAKHLDYRQPDGPAISSPSFAEMFTQSYKLAVIDGVTVAVQLLGQSAGQGDPNDAIVRFFKIFPRRLAKRTGAAVVLVDHVSKDSDGRGRFAIGAQAKMSEIDGANYIVEPVAPPVKGGIGKISLRVAKDRPAGVRKHCGEWRAKDRTQEAAVIEVDSRGETTTVRVHAPETVITEIDPFDVEATRPTAERPEMVMDAISDLLSGQEKGLSKNAIEEAMKGYAGKGKVALALELMTNEGYVEARKGERNAIINTLIKAYRGVEKDDGMDGVAPIVPLRAGR